MKHLYHFFGILYGLLLILHWFSKPITCQWLNDTILTAGINGTDIFDDDPELVIPLAANSSDVKLGEYITKYLKSHGAISQKNFLNIFADYFANRTLTKQILHEHLQASHRAIYNVKTNESHTFESTRAVAFTKLLCDLLDYYSNDTLPGKRVVYDASRRANVIKLQNINEKYCRYYFDRITCWPPVPYGTVVNMSCPLYVAWTNERKTVQIKCTEHGNWSYHATSQDEFCNIYGPCHKQNCSAAYKKAPVKHKHDHAKAKVIDPLQPLVKILRYLTISGYICSLIAITTSLLIFFMLKNLHCPRNFIHVHLFVAFWVKAVLTLIEYSWVIDTRIIIMSSAQFGSAGSNSTRWNQTYGNFSRNRPIFNGNFSQDFSSNNSSDIAQISRILSLSNVTGNSSVSYRATAGAMAATDRTATTWACKIFVTLWTYSHLATFYWMLVEALYLHNYIYFNIFKETGVLPYALVGWGAPLGIIIVWAVCRAMLDNKTCWASYYNVNYIWLIKGPIIFAFMVNFFLLVNIIRQLYSKVRTSDCIESTAKLKRITKSTAILVVLSGVHYFLLTIPQTALGINQLTPGLLALLYIELIPLSLQGLIVAVMYCLHNGEVRSELKRKWRVWSIQKSDSFYRSPSRSSLHHTHSTHNAKSCELVPLNGIPRNPTFTDPVKFSFNLPKSTSSPDHVTLSVQSNASAAHQSNGSLPKLPNDASSPSLPSSPLSDGNNGVAYARNKYRRHSEMPEKPITLVYVNSSSGLSGNPSTACSLLSMSTSPSSPWVSNGLSKTKHLSEDSGYIGSTHGGYMRIPQVDELERLSEDEQSRPSASAFEGGGSFDLLSDVKCQLLDFPGPGGRPAGEAAPEGGKIEDVIRPRFYADVSP